MRASRRARGLQSAIALVLAALWAFPVYWMAVTAIKPRSDVVSRTPVFIPHSPTLEHVRTAIEAPGFWHFARNSLVLTIGAVVIALLAVGSFNYIFTQTLLATHPDMLTLK